MARIESEIVVQDKVSGPLAKMSQAARRLSGDMETTQTAAEKMVAAASGASSGPLASMSRAARRLSGDMGSAKTAAEKLTAAASDMPTGPVNGLRNAVSSLIDKARTAGSAMQSIKTIATGNFLAEAFTRAIDSFGDGISKLIKTSDEIAGIDARIRLVTHSAAEAASMNDMIWASAQRSRGAYDEMAKSVATVAMTAKEAFPDPRQVVPFMEGIQKLFAIGGTGKQQQGDALLQLTQALGKGVLQGDEFRSIAEAAPLIEQMVAKEMGVTQGALKDLSSKGLVTADILRDAILHNMDEINEQFSQMPMKWSDIMTQMKNVAIASFKPLLQIISDIANSQAMKSLAAGITSILPTIGAVAATVVNVFAQIGGVIWTVASYIIGGIGGAISFVGGLISEWSPVILGALTAVAIGWELVNLPLQVYAALAFAAAVRDGILAVAHLALAGVTGILTKAVLALDAVLMANPIMWVVGLVALAIGAWVAWSTATNGLATTIGNAFAGIAAAAGTAVNIVISAVNALIGACNGAADAINGVFGTKIGHLTEIRQVNVETWKQGAFNLGSGLVEGVQNLAIKPAEIPSQDLQFGNMAIPDIGGQAGADLGDAAKSGKETAGNTGRIADTIDPLDEDLKYLRETAEIDAINKYTTATVQINLGGVSNTINNDQDVDGMVDYLVDSLREAMANGAEAVH